ncbi:MAG TPA: PCP reductase family protein [Puia sp.]|nr:PCP reductase family protein [Puia sp.]
MSFAEHIQRMQRIDGFVRRKATGNTLEFARKLGISRITVIRTINEMKDMGFPIKFCRTRCSYYYEYPGKMVEKMFIGMD